ncbi:MAG: hypothetical protein GXY83_18245 [Rhodopirellula sp.]|nr:hypothetical protein [Rhodopirellula sp.]
MGPLTAENAPEIWSQAIASLSGFAGEHAKQFHRVAISAPNRLVVSFPARYTLSQTYCTQNTARFEEALRQIAGAAIRVEFAVLEEAPALVEASQPVRAVNPLQRLGEIAQHPMIRRATELFGAQPQRVDEPRIDG